MADLNPVILRLDGMARVLPSLVPDEASEVSLGLKTVLSEKILRTYRDKADSAEVKKLAESLDLPAKPLIYNTRGRYHHLTYGFVWAMDEESFSYIHIDNHSDIFLKPDLKKGEIGSGFFVHEIADLGKVESVMLLGSTFEGVSSLSGADLDAEHWKQKLSSELDKLEDKVYISVDLDVFSPLYFRTSYNQGDLKLQKFKGLIEFIRNSKDVIGADICGLERPYDSRDKDLYSAVSDTLLGEISDEKVRKVKENAKKGFKELDSDLIESKYSESF